MNVVARKNLEAFGQIHAETEQPLRAWLAAVKSADWRSMDEIVRTYSKVSPLNSERCVFDICGGNYRLVASFNFRARIAFVKFIGPHKAYDRVDATKVSQY